MKRQVLVLVALVASTSASAGVRVFRGPCATLQPETEQPPTAVHPLAGTTPRLCVTASTLADVTAIARQANWTEVLPPAGANDAFLIRATNHAAQQQVVAVAGERAAARLAEQWFVAFGAAELADGLHLCNVQLLQPATGVLPPALHSARNATVGNAAKDDIVNSLDGDELFARLEELSGEKDARIGDEVKRIMTRQSWAANNLDAANYIKQWFDTEGAVDESYLQPFSSSGRNSRNVVGIRYGTTRRDEIVVVGGHFDSTSEQASTYAPGAVDDGSGTLAVLQAVKAFRGYAPTRTIHFVAFSGEEQGLIGSNYYVSNAVNNGWNIVSAVLLDMTAYSYNYYGVIIEGTTNSAIQDLMRRVEQNTLTYSPKLTVAKSNNSFGSDHVPFQRAGIPAVLLIEQDDTNYPGYHRTTDRVSYVNRDQANDIHRGMVGTIYDLAFL